MAHRAQDEDSRAIPASRICSDLGFIRILWLDRIPNHAAVHETVELAKSTGLASKAGFLNAVLRGYVRELDASRQLLSDLKTRQPALGYSHPEWLAARWAERWGPSQTSRLMEWDNTPPKTFARVNLLRTTPDVLLRQWGKEEVEFGLLSRDWLEESSMFELKSHPALGTMPSFQQGMFYIQDPSTVLAARELAAAPGETVLDFCAAPGGKLGCLAQSMGNQGRLFAQDTGLDRMRMIDENCARLGIACVRKIIAGATLDAPAAEFAPGGGSPAPGGERIPDLFDRILVDAPCSNTGVMRRRVNLRWRLRFEEIGRLAAGQLRLLEQAASRLKREGRLVYSTCSLEREENEEVVERFLANHPDFRLGGTRMLLPFTDQVDGAFVARFERSALPTGEKPPG